MSGSIYEMTGQTKQIVELQRNVAAGQNQITELQKQINKLNAQNPKSSPRMTQKQLNFEKPKNTNEID